MTYIIVAFAVKEENSIHYAKCRTLTALFHNIKVASDKGADFLSLRIVK